MTYYDPKDIQWLREIETNDAHRSPNRRMQGVVLDSIPIDASALHIDDCYALIQADIDFVNWAREEAYLVGGEFPQEALWAYYADYYRAQVSNGGHAQFVGNSGFTPIIVGNCLRGLQAIEAHEQASIFRISLHCKNRSSMMRPEIQRMSYSILDTSMLVARICWFRRSTRGCVALSVWSHLLTMRSKRRWTERSVATGSLRSEKKR